MRSLLDDKSYTHPTDFRTSVFSITSVLIHPCTAYILSPCVTAKNYRPPPSVCLYNSHVTEFELCYVCLIWFSDA